MGWGSMAAALVGVALALAPIACAQASEESKPAIAEQRLEVGQIRLTYRAKAGLTPILDADGALYGDMSYFAYEVVTKRGDRPRPIAFVWNGGPGSNSIPLHYGAFGPKRIAGETLEPNAASLLDVADLVFADPIEAGFGRFLGEGNMRGSAELDAEQFAQFIETWLKVHPAHGEIWLIGESYGVYRAVIVADLLRQRDILVSNLILISGYPTLSPPLDETLWGALKIPGFAALAFSLGKLDAGAGADVDSVHDAARAWVLPLYETPTATDDYKAGWPEFLEGLSRFTGVSQQDILGNKLPIGSSGAPHAFRTLARRGPVALFPDISSHDTYDIRRPPDYSQLAWMRRAIVDDVRNTVGLNLSRNYVGLEHDSRSLGASPPNGLARSTAGAVGPRFRVPSIASGEAPAARLLERAPDMRVFVADGMFDGLFPCALGEEMIRRDLAAFADRIASRCYAGGHMMYLEEDVAEKLSADIRRFVAGGLQR